MFLKGFSKFFMDVNLGGKDFLCFCKDSQCVRIRPAPNVVEASVLERASLGGLQQLRKWPHPGVPQAGPA